MPTVINTKKLVAGLAWPDEGYPGFLCVVSERPTDVSSTFDLVKPTVEILYEYESLLLEGVFPRLLSLARMGCRDIYTDLKPENNSYIREFNQFKRRTLLQVALRQTRSSSFEASVLKIKEFVASKRLIMKPDSITKGQLTRFSKVDLKHEAEFFAVRALGMAIHAFKSTDFLHSEPTEVDPSAWY